MRSKRREKPSKIKKQMESSVSIQTGKVKKYVRFGITTSKCDFIGISGDSLYTVEYDSETPSDAIKKFIVENTNLVESNFLFVDTLTNVISSCSSCKDEFKIGIVVVSEMPKVVSSLIQYSTYASQEIDSMTTKDILKNKEFVDSETILFMMFLKSVLSHSF
ncbi:MAG: hypothetical protein ACRCZ9_02440 [Fusobacteriaceae bacterium]